MNTEDFVTIEEVKQQCYLDESDVSEDVYLKMLATAALKHTQNYTNRILYTSVDVIPPEVENGLVWSEDIKMGVLLLIGHWYENRESTSEKRITNIPFGFGALVTPYKFIPV